MQISVFALDMTQIDVRSDKQKDGTPFAVVRVPLGQASLDLHVSGWAGAPSIERGRAFADAVYKACDAVEDELRRKAAVPIESLAPAPESLPPHPRLTPGDDAGAPAGAGVKHVPEPDAWRIR